MASNVLTVLITPPPLCLTTCFSAPPPTPYYYCFPALHLPPPYLLFLCPSSSVSSSCCLCCHRYQVGRWISPRTSSGWSGITTRSSSSSSSTSVRITELVLGPTSSSANPTNLPLPLLHEYNTSADIIV